MQSRKEKRFTARGTQERTKKAIEGIFQQEDKSMSKIYKAEYADGEMEVFSYCDNDREAMEEAESYEKDHGTLFNLFEVDEDYNEIRTVY